MNKLKIQKTLSFLLSIAVVATGFFIFQPQKAVAAGSIYLAPGSATVAKDSYFAVSVRVNSSGVDSVQANLSYPADKLDFTGLSYTGSGFEVEAEGSGGGGSIRIARGTISAKSGDVLVATISFRAKVDSGSATVSFTSGTEGVKAGSVVATAGSGGTYTLTKPAPKPKPDKTAPKISDVQVTGLGLNTATITWTTNEKATSVVEYGPTENLGITSSSAKTVKSHKVSLSSDLLFPGTTYYYQVSSKDAAGNQAKSDVSSFKTKGYKVRVKITGSDGQSLAGVQVTLIPGEVTGVTDNNGVVVFENLATGKYSVQVEFGGQVLAGSISVKEAEDADQVQEFNVQVAAAAKFQLAGEENILPILLAFALLALLVGSMVWWTRKHPIHLLADLSKLSKEKKKPKESKKSKEDEKSEEDSDSPKDKKDE